MTYLGKLCKRKHEHENSGKSLRYKSGACVVCAKILSNAWREKEPEKYKEYQAQYNKEYYTKNKDILKVNARKWYDDNKERVNHRRRTERSKRREFRANTWNIYE